MYVIRNGALCLVAGSSVVPDQLLRGLTVPDANDNDEVRLTDLIRASARLLLIVKPVGDDVVLYRRLYYVDE